MTIEETNENAIRTVVKQFRGGEHALAGQRAAQLVYGGKAKPNQKLLDRIIEGAPGIERYITAPEAVVPLAEDQGGNPLATQPENDPSQNNASNVSSDTAKAEQDAVDKKLEAGRKRAEKAAAKKAIDDAANAAGTGNETKMNPEGSGSEAADNPPAGNPAQD